MERKSYKPQVRRQWGTAVCLPSFPSLSLFWKFAACLPSEEYLGVTRALEIDGLEQQLSRKLRTVCNPPSEWYEVAREVSSPLARAGLQRSWQGAVVGIERPVVKGLKLFS